MENSVSIIISCISTKSFNEKRSMHSKSEAVEVYMGSDTENVIDTLFNTLLQNFQSAQETSRCSFIKKENKPNYFRGRYYIGKFRGAAYSKCNLNYKVPKEIPIVIHNASYDTHFIIDQLAKEFKGELNCTGDNMEKYITFSVPIKKECDSGKTITYKLKFIDSFRSMSTSLPELVDNTSGIFNSTECKSCIKK